MEQPKPQQPSDIIRGALAHVLRSVLLVNLVGTGSKGCVDVCNDARTIRTTVPKGQAELARRVSSDLHKLLLEFEFAVIEK